jgi:hypothetical protein
VIACFTDRSGGIGNWRIRNRFWFGGGIKRDCSFHMDRSMTEIWSTHPLERAIPIC